MSFDDLRAGSIFVAKLLRHLRHPLDLPTAMSMLRTRLDNRENDFLFLVRRAIYERPDSVYAKLLRMAGCDYAELERRVKNDGVARHEKAEMVRALPASGLAVLNGDDGHVMWMASETRARRVTFGFGEANDVRATDMALEWPNGTRFTVHTPKETREIRIRLFGRPGVYSALAAVAVGMMEGIPMTEIVSRLEKVEPTPGRLQPEPALFMGFPITTANCTPAEFRIA